MNCVSLCAPRRTEFASREIKHFLKERRRLSLMDGSESVAGFGAGSCSGLSSAIRLLGSSVQWQDDLGR